MRSERSSERTWERRSAASCACCSAMARSSRRARSTRSAFSRFWICDFSSCIETTMPLGRWVMRTAESVVLTDWPPGPVLDDHVLGVVGISGCKGLLETVLERDDPLLRRPQLVLEQLTALGRALLAEELPSRGHVVPGRLPGTIGANHPAQLGVALGQLDEAPVVGLHRRIRELVLYRGIRLLYLI